MPDVPARTLLGAHSDGSELFVGSQRPVLGDVVPVRVRVPVGEPVDAVRVRVLRDAEPHFVEAVSDGTSPDGDRWFVADVELHNPVTAYRFQLDRGVRGYSWVAGAGEYFRDGTDGNDFRLTSFDPGPDWALDAIVYQVFPDRFARSDADRGLPDWAVATDWDDRVVWRGPDTGRQLFGGDLDGIRERLDHLEHLGVTALYLTPIFPGRSNHRYNASSFATVDPLLGGDEALVRLSQACHARGLRLIGDLTTNHSGDDHPWFRAAQGNSEAPERAFYYMDAAGNYVSWLGHPSLPKFDLESVELRERLFGAGDSVVARWLQPPYELDGWRIDVANMTGRYGAHDHGAAIARLARQAVDAARPESVLIAEYTNDFTPDLIGDGWQGSMNYAGFGRPVWSWLQSVEHEQRLVGTPFAAYRIVRRSGRDTTATMSDFVAAVPWKVAARQWNLIGSHDTARIRSVTGSSTAVRLAAVLLFTYLGVPMVFAGDEIGVEGLTGEDARRPMPWKHEQRWDTATLDAYRQLIALRRSVPALRRGGFRWVVVTENALGFLRETAQETILVVVARAPWAGAVLPLSLAPRGDVEALYGDLDLRVGASGLAVSGDGPAAGIWRLG